MMASPRLLPALFLAVLATANGPPGVRDENFGLQAVEPRVSLDLLDVNGNSTTLSWPTEGPMLLDFMSIDCTPCETQLPMFREWLNATGGGIPLISIEVWGGRGPQSTAFLAEMQQFQFEGQANWPFLLDSSSRAMAHFQASVVPTLILVDEDGTILDRCTGTSCDSSLLARAALLANH